VEPRIVLTAFDTYLADRGLRFEAVVIGGTALNLLGVVRRTTRDCDVLHPEIPAIIQQAAKDFAAERNGLFDPLQSDWLNNGPASLTKVLPQGWQERLIPVFAGQAVVLRSLGRLDLLRTKLFGLCDRAADLVDCVALAPTTGELSLILPWLQEQDGNPEWPAHVIEVLDDLSGRLGHGV
jgi:Nucleotidyltransferase of unknown function (DUF6036)